MEKEEADSENDSYCDSSDFSNESDDNNEEEKEDKKEMPHYWKEGIDISDQAFRHNCKTKFKKDDDIIKLKKENIDTPLKCFLLLFTKPMINEIVSESLQYFKQQVSKSIIKKSENPNSTC